MIFLEMVNDYPVAVRNWLGNSGIIGKERIKEVSLKQKGKLRLQPDQKWSDAEAKQEFNIDEPSFIWELKTSMKGLPVSGRDIFQKGKGSMKIRIAGIIPVVNLKDDPKLNESTLQRYLGEIIWFPSAALSSYISWRHIDNNTAEATMNYMGTIGKGIFSFDEEGNLRKFTSYRYKDIKDKNRTEWIAEVLDTDTVNGVKIPVKLQASWILGDNKFTWFIFTISDLKYNY